MIGVDERLKDWIIPVESMHVTLLVLRLSSKEEENRAKYDSYLWMIDNA